MTMRNLSFILIAFVLLATNAQSKFIVNGKIISYDDKIPKMSHVSYVDSEGYLVVKRTDEEGNFQIEIDLEYYFDLSFMAADHQKITQKFMIPSNSDTLSVYAKLLPNQIYEDLESIYILGNFNEFDYENAPAMKLQSDGKYYFEVNHSSDTLIYQILPEYTKSNSDRTFNGSLQSELQYDLNGDYYSVLISKDRKFKITFDPNYYPKGAFLSDLEIDNFDYSTEFNQYNKIVKEYYQYVGDRSAVFLEKNLTPDQMNAKLMEFKKASLRRVEPLLFDIKDKNIRLLGVIEYLRIAHDGYSIKGVENDVEQSLVYELLNVSPSSKIWDRNSNYVPLAFSEILLGNIVSPNYINKVIEEKHPDETKAGLLSVLVHYCHYAEMNELKAKYYNQLQKDYPKTKEAMHSKANFSDDKSIMVGKKIPDFRLIDLDNEKNMITSDSLKGKFVLVDVWGTWCMPCLMEIPYLHRAYEKFKNKNFTIYSIAIDASASVVKKFRDSKNKTPWLKKEEQVETNMPWLHSYGGNWDSQIINIFEITGVPTTFLIDPDGKIISLSGLRGDELIPTLEKIIK